MFKGWVMAHSEKVSEGILLVEQGLSAWQRIGIRTFLPRNHCLLAEAYLTDERYTEGAFDRRHVCNVFVDRARSTSTQRD
jgi:hypothetical protein